MLTSREVRLVRRPRGTPQASDFQLVERELPPPGPDEVLVQNEHFSVDPYMRGRMDDRDSYALPFELGQALTGRAVGRVLKSRADGIAEGVHVTSMFGWQERFVADAGAVQPVAVSTVPARAALGVLGAPGLAAWVGLHDIGRPRPGDTVFVSAAAGAVGGMAGQLARLAGCRVIGSTGSADKVRYARDELGFDVVFNYRQQDSYTALREAAPNGIDVYFDNVGGEQLDAALACCRDFGRVVLCGMISGYNAEEPPAGPRNIALCITKRLALAGFIVSDHLARLPDFRAEVEPLVTSDQIRYRETIVDGIEHAVEAFLGVLAGKNIGKMLVRVSPID